MKKKVLFIHGFMSGANGETITKFKKLYSYKYDFITPELDADPSKAIPKLNEIIEKEKPSLIVGNSLGGFYALMCDSGNIPKIVVNPCVNPYEHLKIYLNKEMQYHSKRNDGSTTYTLTPQTLEKYKEYNNIKERIKANIGSVFAILSSKDEVLGDTHIKLFEEIKNETNYNFMFFSIYNTFGHRLTYNTNIYLWDVVDNMMYG